MKPDASFAVTRDNVSLVCDYLKENNLSTSLPEVRPYFFITKGDMTSLRYFISEWRALAYPRKDSPRVMALKERISRLENALIEAGVPIPW